MCQIQRNQHNIQFLSSNKFLKNYQPMTDVSKDNFFLHNQTDMHARTHTHTHTPGPSLGLYQAAPLSSTEAIINNYQYWIFLSHENEMFTGSINYMKMKVFLFFNCCAILWEGLVHEQYHKRCQCCIIFSPKRTEI